MRKRVRARKNRKGTYNGRLYKKIRNITVIILIPILFTVIFAVINLTSTKILNGITINGLNISGLTIEEARAYINETIEKKIRDGIKLNHDGQEYNFELNELDIAYDFNNKLQEAYLIGRSGNIIKDNFTILYMFFAKKDFYFDVVYNEELFERQIDYLEIQLPDRAVDNKYYVEEKDVIIVKGLDGVLIDKDRIKEIVTLQLSNLLHDNTEELAIIEKPVEKLSIDKIYEEIYKEAKDAYYEEEPFKVYPHVVGVDFALSKEEIEEKLKKDEKDYAIPLKFTEPNVKLEDLKINAFPDLIARFETVYDVQNKNRKDNLTLALEKVNNVIVQPGEVFSYNKTLGVRTVENGYKEAPIYANGKVVNGLGGGICQISTMLYNSAILANLQIIERKNHMFLPSYVEAGHDATVVYGSIDFKFKNTREYPIKIIASANSGVARMSIYGLFAEKEYDIELETEVISTTPYKTVYINDESIEKGEEVIIQNGQDGTKVKTFKIVRDGIEEISRTLISTDTYRPMQKTILKNE